MNDWKNHLQTIGKFLLFAGIGLSILYYVYVQQNAAFQEQCALDNIVAADCNLLDKVWSDFGKVKIFWIIMILVVYLYSNVLRAQRWQSLLKPLGYEIRFYNAFFAMMIGYFVNSFLPRAGEIAKSGAVARYEKIPLEQVLGTITLSRMIDVVCLATMIGMALLLEFGKLWGWLQQNAFQQGGNSPLIWIALLGLLGLVLAFVFRKNLQRFKIYRRIETIVKGFTQGFLSVKDVEKPVIFIIQTLLIWLMYYFTIYFAFFAFPPTESLGASAALLVFVFGAFGIVIPSPGGLGTYHFLIITALTTFYAVSRPDAFTFSMIAFFTIYLANLIVGLISSIMLPLINDRS